MGSAPLLRSAGARPPSRFQLSGLTQTSLSFVSCAHRHLAFAVGGPVNEAMKIGRRCADVNRLHRVGLLVGDAPTDEIGRNHTLRQRCAVDATADQIKSVLCALAVGRDDERTSLRIVLEEVGERAIDIGISEIERFLMDVRRRADINEDRALAITRRIDRTAAIIEAGLIGHHPARILFGLAVGIERRIPAGATHIARRMNKEDVDLAVFRSSFDAGGNVSRETGVRRKRCPRAGIGIVRRRRLGVCIPNAPRPEETKDHPKIAGKVKRSAGRSDQDDDRSNGANDVKENSHRRPPPQFRASRRAYRLIPPSNIF